MSETNDTPQDQATPEQVEETATPEKAEEQPDTLGEPGKKALEEERAARKEAEKRLKELAAKVEQFEDSKRTDEERREHELEKLRKQAEEERTTREALERRLLVNEVATKFGLPADLAERLRGEDREALEADAQVLKALVVPDGPRKPAPVPEAGSDNGPKLSTADQFSAAIQAALNR